MKSHARGKVRAPRSGSVPAVAERFTAEELEALHQRANELAVEQETDASLRAALQAFAETAANLAVKVKGTELLSTD